MITKPSRLPKFLQRAFGKSKPTTHVPTLTEAAPWNADAAALLRQYLDTSAGKVFLAQLAFYRPSLNTVGNVEAVALQAQLAAGYEMALKMILSLAEPPDDQATGPEENYPPLEDDSQWTTDNKRRE